MECSWSCVPEWGWAPGGQSLSCDWPGCLWRRGGCGGRLSPLALCYSKLSWVKKVKTSGLGLARPISQTSESQIPDRNKHGSDFFFPFFPEICWQGNGCLIVARYVLKWVHGSLKAKNKLNSWLFFNPRLTVMYTNRNKTFLPSRNSIVLQGYLLYPQGWEYCLALSR